MVRVLRIISTWIVLLLATQYFVAWITRHSHITGPLIHRGHGSGDVVDVYIFQDNEEFSVQDHVDLNLEQRTPIGYYTFIVREEYLPIEFFYEFFTRSSLTVAVGDAVQIPGYSDRLILSSTQSAELESMLYYFAHNHKVLSKVNPGGPSVVRFDWNHANFSLILLVSFGVASASMTAGIESEIKKHKDKRATRDMDQSGI